MSVPSMWYKFTPHVTGTTEKVVGRRWSEAVVTIARHKGVRAFYCPGTVSHNKG
jgi:hypothetical protein